MPNFTIRFQCKPLPNGKECPVRKMGVPQHLPADPSKGGPAVSQMVGLEEAKRHALEVTRKDDLVLLEILDDSGAVVAKLI